MKKCLPLFLALSAFIGCTHMPIKNLRKNESKLGYEFNTFADTSKAWARANWRVLRDPVSKKKYTDSSEAYQLVERYNTKQNEIKFSDVYIAPKAFSYSQYKSGREYFEGIKHLKNKYHVNALRHFRKALKADQSLWYFSDIYYLMSLCSYGLEDTVKTSLYFDNFVQYSESIVPGSFCHKGNNNKYSIGQLAEQNINCDSLYAGHFTDECKGPVLKHYPYCGFLYKLEDKPIMDIALGMGYDGIKINMFYSLGMTFKYGFKPYIIAQLDGWGGGIKYQIYRRWDNRLGVLADLQYRNLTLDIGDFEKIKFQNYGLEIQTGYYLLPRLCLFLGGKYYYWNENNNYFSENAGYYVWHNNNIYSGASFFLFEHLALVGKYSRNKKAQVGLYLFGVDMLFDFSKTKDFVVDVTYW